MRREISILLTAALTMSCCAFSAAAEETVENMLSNPGFESELLGADDWKFTNKGGWYNEGDITSERTNSERNGGEYSVKLNNATVGQRVSLEAGNTYRLTAYVKADSDTVSPDFGFYDGSQPYPSSDPVKTIGISANAQWQEVSVDFECTLAQDYVICLMTWDDSVNVYFDDVALYKVEVPFESGGIVNGDFSDTTGWTVEGAGAIKDGVFSVSGTDYESRVSQTVTGVENGVYDITAYVTSTDISGTAYLYAKSEGHTMASTALPQTETAMRITVPGVTVDNGSFDVGLYASGSSAITLDKVSLAESEETRMPLLKGGEISKLTYVEDNGAKFYYADGTEGDALQIMAENGFNLARIRLLNDPGKGHGDGEYYLPAGYMTEEDCLRLARRAKDKGMQICFTFAYSDYWVDGEKQMVPYSWQQEINELGLSGETLLTYLEDKVYDYTVDVMEKLIAQGTQPEYVSIGNEIQVGMLFNKDTKSILYNNAANLARMLSAGAQAVRDTSPESKIIFHSDNGGNLYRRSTFISALRTVDSALYDVIGVSYYPYYNKDYSIDTVVNDFAKVINEFDKDVIIMETGYNWSEKRGDGYEGQLEDCGYYQDIYGESQNGQRAFLTELYAKLRQVAGGRCIGDMYWDPVMVYDGGDYTIGWAISEDGGWTQGNVVSNSTIFDFTGKEVAGQRAMRYNTNSSDNINITGTVTSGGKAVTEKEITFTVNGKKHNVTTDKFGKYIVSVPYPETELLEISAKGSEKTYSTDAPYDGILVSDINFDDFDLTTAPDEPETPEEPELRLTVTTEGGAIGYSVETGGESGKLYVTVFDGSGKLTGIRTDESTGSFEGLENGEYTLKAFLWDQDQTPVLDAAKSSCTLSQE